MATPVIMPRQGQSVESCVITKWNKKAGDTVDAGELLFSYETDKAAFDEFSAISGVVLKIFHPDGDDVPCLENVCVIGEPGEDTDAFAADETGIAQTESAPAYPTPEKPLGGSSGERERSDGFVRVSPRAKTAAAARGLDPADATPSGAHGRVTERDIAELAKRRATEEACEMPDILPETAPTFSASPHGYTDIPHSAVRKATASAMHRSLSTMAQLTHTTSFDATAILALRRQIKSGPESMELPNITLNDMILFAVSRVLPSCKSLNANYFDDKLRVFDSVNLGIAVDTPRGLLVPTLFDAGSMSLAEISEGAKKLVAEAQSGKISPDKLTGAGFTVTNLGVFGIESFTPVINPPQTGILGVCGITTRVRDAEGRAVPYQAMGLSLTYDHRALDGAPASRFLRDLCTALENFGAFLVK